MANTADVAPSAARNVQVRPPQEVMRVAKRKSAKTAPWDRDNPKTKRGGGSRKLSPAKKAKAKSRAKRAGRPYPNLVDNMAVARQGRSTRKRTTTRKTSAKKGAAKRTTAKKKGRKTKAEGRK